MNPAVFAGNMRAICTDPSDVSVVRRALAESFMVLEALGFTEGCIVLMDRLNAKAMPTQPTPLKAYKGDGWL